MKLIVLNLVVCLQFFSGCSEHRTFEFGEKGFALSLNSATSEPVENMSNLIEQYPLFNASYDFLQNSDSDREFPKTAFPIHEMGSSDIAALSIDGEMFGYRIQLIRAAQTSIRMQALVFWADEAGWFLADELVAAKKRGVNVTVIVDGFSNLGVRTQRMYEYLKDNGIFVGGYYLRQLTSENLESMSGVSDLLDKVKYIYRRFHEKSFVVDAESPENGRAIIGGANTAKTYFRLSPHKPHRQWVDQEIALRGEVVQQVSHLFDLNLLDFKEFRSEGQPESLDSSDWQELNALLQREDFLDFFRNHRDNPDPETMKEIERQIALDIQPAWNKTTLRVLRNRPRHDERYIEDAYTSLFASAQEEINIVNAYFMPEEHVLNSIKDAVRRGVRVNILTNSPDSSEVRVLGMASRTYYKDFLSINEEGHPGSLHVYEWAGYKTKNNGQGHLHAKFAVVDGLVSAVGSFNFDRRSRWHNSENVVLSLGSSFASPLQDYMHSLMSSENSDEITYDMAKDFVQDSGFIDKVLYGTARVIRPFL